MALFDTVRKGHKCRPENSVHNGAIPLGTIPRILYAMRPMATIFQFPARAVRQVVAIQLPMDQEMVDWLNQMAIDTGDQPENLIVSMLRSIFEDDKRMHSFN